MVQAQTRRSNRSVKVEAKAEGSHVGDSGVEGDIIGPSPKIRDNDHLFSKCPKHCRIGSFDGLIVEDTASTTKTHRKN